MFNDIVKASGKPYLTLYAEDGSIKERREIDNMVVTTGKGYIAGMMSNTPPTTMSRIAVGTGSVAPVLANTALGVEIGTRATTTVTNTAGSNVINYSAVFGPGNATGSLTEAGIFNAVTGGTMLARVTFAQINKASSDTITVSWSVTIA